MAQFQLLDFWTVSLGVRLLRALPRRDNAAIAALHTRLWLLEDRDVGVGVVSPFALGARRQPHPPNQVAESLV
jgi:hypothetical protein